MKKLIYILVCFTFSCNPSLEKPEKPDHLIPEDKMADIMYDVFLLNSAKGVKKEMLEFNGVDPENYVFEKYDIDSTTFANNNNYYAYYTKTYESILKRIREKIDLEKKKYEAQEKIEEAERKRKNDSLREVRKKRKDSILKLKIKPPTRSRKK